MKSVYWYNFWTTSPILNEKNPQLKVGRSINGVPIDSDKWQQTLSFLSCQLELNENDKVLDIASGSGMISIPFSKKVKSICAIDISRELLKNYSDVNNINTIVADIIEYDSSEKFDKIIFYFALQYFSAEECYSLFEKIYKWLSPGGIAYIGDIPDINLLFNYFNSKEREKAFFDSIKNNKPIIGTWHSRKYLFKLGKYVGFEHVEIINQPSSFINSHYRFDIKLLKK